MQTYRENPEGEENQRATKQHEREMFALKMQAQADSDKPMTPAQTKRAIEIMQKDGQDGWRIEWRQDPRFEWLHITGIDWNWTRGEHRAVGPRKRVQLKYGMEVKFHAAFPGLICLDPLKGCVDPFDYCVDCFDGSAVVEWDAKELTHYRWPNGNGEWLPIEGEPEIISMEGVE